MRRVGLAIAIASLGLSAIAPSAFAATPDESCWGVVTHQLATSGTGIGSHVSAQSEPRLGLGNVARLFLGDDAKVYELGTLLASIDGNPATSCP